ncbi:hypothetical protein G9F32_07475 [Acinetobacter sp. 194]|uniref:hypothetical protein n=1 Tax=Acinetobacter shaoyimingii TaxID=2715164 RepID=UPI00140A06A7|nr:hypothetical protein [Acinetobacter shaoyimingii]NHB57871.1 hypothetical protein [Acinetobacter shaoyimingii]
MRTLVTIIVGMIIFMIIFMLLKHIKNKSNFRLAMWIFLPLWLVLVSWNMYHGISLGYGFMEEIPFFLINLLVPIFLVFIVFKSQFAKQID